MIKARIFLDCKRYLDPIQIRYSLGQTTTTKRKIEQLQGHSRVQGDFVSTHDMVITVRPVFFPLPPSCHVLADQIITHLFGLVDVGESSDAAIAGRVVDGNKALPLLDSKRLVIREIKPTHLTLGIKGVKIDMGHNSQRT